MVERMIAVSHSSSGHLFNPGSLLSTLLFGLLESRNFFFAPWSAVHRKIRSATILLIVGPSVCVLLAGSLG